ncbi:helix-turn-helix transcriptional regulator [Planctomycetales bacterium ZRK34]|nr:helix-turn-helix transcriptional regulator [Planctomycetales bacterium ZRK34]
MIDEMNKDRGWLKKMAAAEDNSPISVGGLAAELGAPSPDEPLLLKAIAPAFAKLVELARRANHLTVEELAEKANIEITELLAIESGGSLDLEPRTVFQIAKTLKLPGPKLLMLSGLAKAKSVDFDEAAVRFAAHSKGVEELSQEEHEALEEFVRYLGEG